MIVTQNGKGPATAPTVPGHGSTSIPQMETNMNKHLDSTEAAAKPVSRRNFLAVAAASAALAPSVLASNGFAHSPAGDEFDELAARIRDVLARMHPAAGKLCVYLNSRDDGSFRFTIQGNVKFQPFQGDGIYIVSVDGWMHEHLVREERIFSLGSKDVGSSHYYGRARTDDGGWDDHERFVTCFVRKVGEVPA